MAIIKYTDIEISRMIEVYKNAENDCDRLLAVKSLALELDKPIVSVRVKLVKMGVYIKPYDNKVKSIKKQELVNIIASVTGKDVDLMGSLEKATKYALESIIEQFDLYETIILKFESEYENET